MSRKRRKQRRATSKPSRAITKQSSAAQRTDAKAQSKTVPVSTGSALPLPTQNLYLILFLVNIIVAFFWQLMIPLFGILDYLIGFLLGFLAITLFHRRYGRRTYHVLYFVGYVLWQMVLSNLIIAKLVLQPKPKLDPGIIGVPLTVTSALEITILASVITLTPGTISVDLGHNAAGQQVLYIHNLTVGDPDQFRQRIKDGFERLLLQASRGAIA